jgi:hypothetical protein
MDPFKIIYFITWSLTRLNFLVKNLWQTIISVVIIFIWYKLITNRDRVKDFLSVIYEIWLEISW